MLTVYVRVAGERLEIGHGEIRAQFERQDNYWVPLWMWHGDQRVLRFKNHEWFSLGHVRPKASDWEVVEDTSEQVLVRFSGQDSCFGVPVEWSVWVGANMRWPGFTITTEIVPAQTIELLECFTRFETPPDYDGREEVLCAISQHPVALRREDKWVTPHAKQPSPGVQNDPVALAVSAVRTPFCCVRIRSSDRTSASSVELSHERYLTLFGHWDTCCFRTIGVRRTGATGDFRAYEFLVGALDSQCNRESDLNVFFDGDTTYRQRVSIAFSPEMPGGALDRWYYGAFERSLRHHFLAPASVEVEQRVREKKVSLAEANAWLLEMIGGAGTPGLYSPDQGIVDYVEGTSPDAGHFSLVALTPWLAMLGYRGYVIRRDDLLQVCERWVERLAEVIEKLQPMRWQACPVFFEVLPLLRYLKALPNDALHVAVRQVLGRMLETFPPEGGDSPGLELGHEVFHCEAYLLAGQLSGDKRLLDAGRVCLERINAAARGEFWRFACAGESEDPAVGARMLPLAYGHAIVCNLNAYQISHDESHMETAGMFARYLVSMCYGVYNDSEDADFDVRGFAGIHPGEQGRPFACGPMESSDSLRCVAYWLGFRPDNPAGFYDLIWLLSRTFCGVFPAARGQRTGHAPNGRPLTRPNEDLPTAIAYQRFPYVAYEDPLRQIRQSPRASVEALQNYLTFGGGLASCDNDRILVLVPRAAGYDLAERVGRMVHVYNANEVAEETRLAIHHLSARRPFDVLVGGKRVAAGLSGDALKDIAVQIPPRRAVVVEAIPSRQPTSF